ncbi:MAG: tetratricopeptide repeat protein [Candidatus Krumholzibacteriia bacterium]
MLRRFDGRWMAAACVGVAVVVRAVFVLATRDDPVFRVPYLDGAFYHAWARSLAEGRGDFQGPYFLGPLYPHALSWLYRVTGPEPFAVRVLQSALGVLGVALVLALGRRLFGNLAGCAAALLLGLYGTLAFHEGLLVMESLLLTLVLGAFAVVLLPRWPKPWRASLAGLLLGLATLGRGTILLAAPVVVAMLWDAEDRRRSWQSITVAGIVWFLVLAPVLARNRAQGGGLILTTNAGVNFYAGNAPRANGRFRQPPGVRFFTTPLPDLEDAALPSAVVARALTVEAIAGTREAADSSMWLARSWEWIRQEPGRFAWLLLRKVGLLLQAREIPQIESYAFHRDRIGTFRMFFVDLTWILPLASLGVWRARREKRAGTGFVIGFAAATLLPCVLFFVTARYRLAALPYVALLAGFGAATLGTWVARRQTTRAVMALVILVALGALTRVGAKPPRTAPGWQNAQMAERVYALGDLEAAIRYQEEAARWLPRRMEVQLNLALYWSERDAPGDVERAERLLLELLLRTPGEPLLHFNVGVIFEQQGKLREARAAWARALRLDPNFAPARDRLRAVNAPDTLQPRP